MERKTSILAAAALAALLAGGQAAAQNSGWYVGGGLGGAQAKFERGDFASLETTGPYTVDDKDTGARIFGGYRMSRNWALEFGIASLGRYKHRFAAAAGTAVYHYDASAATVALGANLPLAGGVSLNGRLGAAFTVANLRLAVDNGTANDLSSCDNGWWDDECTSSKTNAFWGLGAQFDISPRWGIRLDYDNYGKVGEEFESGRARIEAWSANVVFRF